MGCELQDFLNERGTAIFIYIAKETVVDQLDGTVELTFYNPIPIKGLVEDLTDAQAVWKLPGIKTLDAKVVTINKKYKSIIQNCHKIVINSCEYYGYRDNAGKYLRMKEEGIFLRLYLTRGI